MPTPARASARNASGASSCGGSRSPSRSLSCRTVPGELSSAVRRKATSSSGTTATPA
jgi:hypothetical protein